MTMVWTLEGSTNHAIRCSSLVDPFRVVFQQRLDASFHGLKPVATVGQPLRGWEVP
jgi:hypothetical protein